MSLDFIDEQPDPQGEATPTLAEVFKKAMENVSGEIRVSCPAEVIRYDKDKQLVDVRPDFNRKYKDGKVEEAPVIYNVPVEHPRAGKAIIHLPLKVGHKVKLSFADRSLEKWLSSGARGAPEDTRTHHVSDAIAYPGCYPFSDSLPINNDDDIIIRNTNDDERVEIRVKANGHLQILNKKEELVNVLADFVRIVREAVMYTSSGKLHLRHSKFEELEDRIKTFLEK